MKAAVDIAITTDEHYMQHAGVMLASLFAHHAGVVFRVHLVSNAVHHADYRKLQALVTGAGHQLRPATLDAGRLAHLKLSAHATTAVYYRLLIPELLDGSITKVLYLDCDLIVKDNLLPLWETPLTDYPVAAVAEPHFAGHQALGLPAGAPYFNSGVMLINLPVWREKAVSQRAIAFLQQHPDKIEAWDQDALNVVLAGHWLSLHPRWNQQTIHFEPHKHSFPLDGQTLKACLMQPAIIHYTAKFKPWQYWCEHPRKAEYYRYLRLTPWKNFRLPEHRPWNRFTQFVAKKVQRLKF